jgi:hypothetical protein
MTLPLGYRNKNPGNLRYRKEWGWPGVVGIDSKQFAIFASPEDGLAAWIRQMRRYRKRGQDTLRKVVPIYAPATENDVNAYLSSVVKQTNIAPDKALTWEDRDETIKLMRAFVRHELGKPPADWPDGEWYDRAVYVRAWDKAKPLSKSKTIGGAVGAATATVAGAVVEVATQQTEVITGAAGAAASIWPKWAPLIAAVVALCCIAWVIYARLQRTKPDEAPEIPFNPPEVSDGNHQ